MGGLENGQERPMSSATCVTCLVEERGEIYSKKVVVKQLVFLLMSYVYIK